MEYRVLKGMHTFITMVKTVLVSSKTKLAVVSKQLSHYNSPHNLLPRRSSAYRGVPLKRFHNARVGTCANIYFTLRKTRQWSITLSGFIAPRYLTQKVMDFVDCVISKQKLAHLITKVHCYRVPVALICSR